MNNEALNHAYNLFKNDGYDGSVDEFSSLMSTNDDAVNYAYSLFKNDGYTNSIDDFKDLIEVDSKFEVYNIMDDITKDHPNVIDFAGENYFRTDHYVNIDGVQYKGFEDYRNRPGNYKFQDYTDDIKSYGTTEEEDLKVYFENRGINFEDYKNFTNNKEFNYDLISPGEIENAIKHEQQYAVQNYIKGIDDDKLRNEIQENLQNDLYSIFDIDDPEDEKYIDLLKEAINKDRKLKAEGEEDLPLGFDPDRHSGVYDTEWKGYAGENTKKVLNKYIENKSKRIEFDLSGLNKKFEKLGEVDENSSPEKITEYNNLVEQSVIINNRIDKLINNAEKVDDANLAIKAFGLRYRFDDNAGINLRNAASSGALMFGGLLKWAGIDDPTSYDTMLSYDRLTRYKKEKMYPLPARFKDYKIENTGEFINSLMAENVFSIGTALSYAGVVKLAAKKVVKKQVAKNAGKLVMSSFFNVEGGSQLGSLEERQNIAATQVPILRQRLNKTTDETERLDILRELDKYEKDLNITERDKAFSSITYGGIATIAERLGTMGIINRLHGVAKVAGPAKFKNILRTSGGYAFGTGVEYTEEVLTQIGHNITDNVILKENKSIIDGVDADFSMNVLFSALAIQGPSMGMNVINTVRSEFSTAQERKTRVARTERLMDLQTQLDDLIENTPIDDQTGRKIVSEQQQQQEQYLKEEINKVLKEAAWDDVRTFADIANMDDADIRQIAENMAKIRELKEKAFYEGTTSGIGERSKYSEQKIQKIKDQINNLVAQNDQLRKKPEERRLISLQETLGKDNVSAEAEFYFGQYKQFLKITEGIEGSETLEFKTFEDVQLHLNKLLQKGDITIDKYEEYIETLKTAPGTVVEGLNQILLVENNVKNNIGNEKLNNEQKAMIAYAPFHELQHLFDLQAGVIEGVEVVEKHKQGLDELANHLENLYKQGRIKKDKYETAKKRLDSYKDKDTNKVRPDELKTLYGEFMNAGIISKHDDSVMLSLKALINSFTVNNFGKNAWVFKMKSAEEVLAYIRRFQKQTLKDAIKMQAPPEEQEGDVKASKGILNDITNLLPINVKTKDDYDAFIADPNRNKVLFDALKDNGVISNYIKSRAVSKEESDLILQEVTDRIIGLVGEGFNPEAKRADDTIVGREGFGEYIFANTRFAKMVARKELATKKPTISIDAKKPTEEGDVGFDIADTEQKTPEETMIAKQEAKKEKTDEQKRNEFLKRVGFNEEIKNKIVDTVIKTFGIKLPEVTSKQFKLALQRAFENELKNVIQKEFGIGKNYDLFLKTLFPTVFKRLTPEQLTQIERRVPKTGKKIFATRKRITKKAEVERLQNEGLIAMDVDYKTGPWLSTKMKTPTIRQTMAFFRGKYETLDKTGKVVKTESIQDILGYTIGKSAFGPRKDALAEAIAVELAFDSSIEVLKDPKVLERRQAIETLQGREKADNYIAEVAQKIRRNPNIKLSRAINEKASERAYKIFAINRPAFLEKIREYGFDKAAIKRAYDEVYKEFNLRTFDNKPLRPIVVNSYTKMIKPFLKINERHKKGNQVFPQTLEDYVSTVDLATPDVTIAQFFKLNQDIASLFRNPNQLKQYKEFLQNIVINIKEKHNLSDQDLAKMLIRAKSFAENGSKDLAKRKMAYYDKADFTKGILTLVYPNADTYVREAYRKKNDPKKNVYSKVTILDKKGKVLDEFDILIEPTQGVTQDMVDNTVSKKEKAARKEASDFHWDVLNKFLEEASILVKDKETKYSKNEMAMLSAGFLGNMKTSLRASALFKYAVLNPFDNNPKNYEYEHGIPALIMMLHLLDHHFAGNKVDLNKLKESYAVGAIHDDMNGNLAIIFKKRMHFDYKIYDIAPKRWYNMYMAAGVTHAVVDIYSGKKYGELQAAEWKGIKKMKDKLEAKQVKEKAKLQKAVVKGRKTIKESKGITVLDFDDTLATTKSLVKFTTPEGKTGTLNAEEYASTYEDLLDKGYTFDFSDFNKVVKGKLAPLFNKAIKLQGKFGPENMFVLTARPPQAQKAIFDFLKANGLNIPLKNITGLGNSTAEAKALWVADKVGEGYNDFYFADDALQNVQAVKNMLDQFDVKSKVQQAKVKFSKGINDQFNDILENVTGIESKKRFSAIKARKRGEKKGRFRFFIPPSHEDFVGLLYNFIGKGKEGNAHRDFFEKALIRPLNRAYRELNAAKQSIANDYKSLNKQFADIKKKLTKKTPDGDFTYQDAIRTYLWDKHGHKVPGLSETDQKNLVDLVKSDPKLQAYAETLNTISKQDKYVAPTENWEAGDIRTDLDDATGRIGRAEFFTEFNENTDIIFSQENLNKIEAAYGADVVSAIKDMLYRIQTGQNRPSGQNALVNKFLNYLNGSVASTMFFNIRSAVLQQMSMVNFINFADNNIFTAAKAFANQKQYWTDWATIFNSDFMKQRRKGIQTDVNGAELAASVKNAKNPIQAAIKKLLELGFLPTQIGDNIAIATGGATFLRNRINTYLKQGLSKKEAETKAFVDFEILAEATQQSARPDMVSQQQASPLGKVILAFQNVTSQFNRLGKKAFLDIKNRRITPGNPTQLQSDMSNLSRIAYYFAIQNLIFYSLQSALFMAMFDDDEEDERWLKKKERMVNGSIDSVLRGAGVWGAAVATLKNMAIKWHEQRDKGWNKDESAVLMEMLNVSPPLGIKARKLVNAEKTLNYNKKVIDEMETFDIDNPMWSAYTNYIESTTNIPLNRLYNKTQNVRQSLDNQHSAFERALMFSGWSKWNLGIEDVKKEKKKQKFGTKKTQLKTIKLEKIKIK